MSIIKQITSDYIPFGSGLPRSPGTHVSSVIRDLSETLGLGPNKISGWDMGVCADIGFLWEDALSIAYRHKRVWTGDEELDKFVVPGVCGDIFRPDEIVMDGIICSPDGFGPDPFGVEDLVDHEFKFTWRSSAKDPRSDFYWDSQFQCYCRAMNTTVTVLHVMYVWGNWKDTGPQHMVYRIQYDPGEIEETWRAVVGHSKKMGKGE